MATGHTGQQYHRPGGTVRPPPKFSNGVVAAVLAIPVLLGVPVLIRAFNNLNNDPFRPHGALAPPQNPWLR